jgi:hypothetical protein
MFGTVLLSIAGLVLGAVITVLVSLYFYNRSLRHRFGVYRISHSEPFSRIDPSIKKALNINFRGQRIENLTVLNLLFANEGVSAIRDCIAPPSISFPRGVSLVDASLEYVYPEGRSVDIEHSRNNFQANFPILNPGEYFVVKVLLDGEIWYAGLECTITADNLPPKIRIKDGEGITRIEKKKRPDYGGVVVSCVALALGVSVLWQMYLSIRHLWLLNTLNVASAAGAATVGVPLAAIGLVAICVTTVGLFKPGRRFVLPRQMANRRIDVHGRYLVDNRAVSQKPTQPLDH